MLETLDYTIRIGSTPTFLYSDLFIFTLFTLNCVYFEWSLPVRLENDARATSEKSHIRFVVDNYIV